MKRLSWLLTSILLSCNTQSNKVQLILPPHIAPEPVTQDYWSASVTDDYRNLENTEDSTVQKWFEAQADYANAIFDRLLGSRPSRKTVSS